MSGSIDPNGNFAIDGEGIEADGSIGEDGVSFSGEFTWGAASGTVSGDVVGEHDVWWNHPDLPAFTGPIPRFEKPVGATDTFDLSVYFPSPRAGTWEYQATSEDPSVAGVSIVGTMLTVTAISPGITYATVTGILPSGYSEVLANVHIKVHGQRPEQPETPPNAGTGNKLIGKPHVFCRFRVFDPTDPAWARISENLKFHGIIPASRVPNHVPYGSRHTACVWQWGDNTYKTYSESLNGCSVPVVNKWPLCRGDTDDDGVRFEIHRFPCSADSVITSSGQIAWGCERTWEPVIGMYEGTSVRSCGYQYTHGCRLFE